MRYSICAFITTFLLWGCHAKPTSPQENILSNEIPVHSQVSLKPLKKGVVIDSVICSDDPSQIYAIYLPTKYDSSKKWPIIYFFDPHGVGNLPVILYKDLAEKYGFILAGTYNSENGMSWENTEKAARAFMKDTRMLLSLDNNRLYTFGFSGGAMVASMVAITEGGIAGVVACGGSLPGDHPPLKQPFSYISFVGNKDFHYVPAEQLDKLLDSTSLSHQLVVFDGKHQWPPVSCIGRAFQWLDADAMRTKAIPVNDSIVKSIIDEFVNEAETWHKKGNILQEYYTYKKLINFLRNVSDISEFTSKVKQIESTETLKEYFANETRLETDELQQMDDFRAHLSQMDEDWWNTKISGMEKRIKKDTTSPEALETQRMLGYLSLAIYMGADGEFKSGNYQAASYFVGLYAIVDPSNPEHSYLSACLDMVNHNSAKVLEMLNDAVRLGFSDSKRLQQDSNFVALRDTPEFKKILKGIASKSQKLDMTR